MCLYEAQIAGEPLQDHWSSGYSGQIRTLVAIATYYFHRLIIFYCFIADNRILFLQKCLLNSSPHFMRLLSELLYLIGCRGKIKS